MLDRGTRLASDQQFPKACAGGIEGEDRVCAKVDEQQVVTDPFPPRCPHVGAEASHAHCEPVPAYPSPVRDPLEKPEEAIRRVYAYVAYRIGAGHDAEDVTSATIERAVRYRHTYRSSEGPPAAWLIGIARRCIADAVSHGAQDRLGVLEVETPQPDHSGASNDKIDLGRAVGRLEPRSRELIALRYGANLRSKEIAAILDMSPGAVDVALHRALMELRGELVAPSS